MKIAFFSSKDFEKDFFLRENKDKHEIVFFGKKLNSETVDLIKDGSFEAICCFVNDVVDEAVLKELAKNGVKLVALRSAGFNNVDLKVASLLGLTVVRVPNYSPYSVSEHAVALILSLNRKTHLANRRVRDFNFALHGLMGFDLHGKTVGLVGTGKIGYMFASIMKGFGCNLLGYSDIQNPDCFEIGLKYVSFDELLAGSDIISLHCPLIPETHHLIGSNAISKMKDGVMLINTSRGGVVDAEAAIEGLKSKKIGYLGMDVYEDEGPLFFEDRSDEIMQDDVFARLVSFPNVIITGHQAFFTKEAVSDIVRITLDNISAFEKGEKVNVVNE